MIKINIEGHVEKCVTFHITKRKRRKVFILLKSTPPGAQKFQYLKKHIFEETDSPCGIIIPHPALVVDELFCSDFEMSF